MSIWQTQSWQDMLIASWQSDEYFIIERDIENKQEADYKKVFVEKRRVSLWEYGLFVIGLEEEMDENLQENLQNLCQEENCLFVQVETIDYSMQPLSLEKGENSRESFVSKYYKKFIPPYTALIDLELGEEGILANMKPKGRYNIKLARKKWVVVEQVEKNLGNIETFHKLMSETTSRDNFAGNTLEFYTTFLESLDDSQLFFAYHEEEVIAAWIFVAFENTMIYYYGASSSQKRNLMAPYLLQWTAIEHGVKRGLKYYDFLWVAGPDEENSPLAGVTDFKLKLTKNRVLVSDSYIYIHKKWKYFLIKLLGKIKSFL